jgi:hypothetical protein
MQGRSVTLVADLDVSGPHSSPNSRIVVRPPLAAGLAFLEVTCGSAYPLADLCTWLHDHLVEPGHMTMPETVREPGLAPVSLGALGRSSAGVADVRAARVVEVARGRVAATLSALLGRPADDRFLAGALYAGRVRRVTAVHDTRCVWRPSPRPRTGSATWSWPASPPTRSITATSTTSASASATGAAASASRPAPPPATAAPTTRAWRSDAGVTGMRPASLPERG